MKKNIISISVAVFFIAAIVSVVLAKVNTTFEINNHTSLKIGIVTVNLESGTTVDVDVKTGVFDIDIDSAVTSVTINGTKAPVGTTTTLNLVNTAQIKCTVTSAGADITM